MDRYIPSEEELLRSLVGRVDPDELLAAMGLHSARNEDYQVVVYPKGNGLFDNDGVRLADEDEIRLHEESVHHHHLLEAECGIL